jgi:hypothetical protein
VDAPVRFPPGHKFEKLFEKFRNRSIFHRPIENPGRVARTWSSLKQTNKKNVTHHAVEVELVGHPVPRLLELVLHPHNVEGVQSVHYCGGEGQRAEDAGAVPPLADRFQFVLAPGVAHVIIPRVLHHLEVEERS